MKRFAAALSISVESSDFLLTYINVSYEVLGSHFQTVEVCEYMEHSLTLQFFLSIIIIMYFVVNNEKKKLV